MFIYMLVLIVPIARTHNIDQSDHTLLTHSNYTVSLHTQYIVSTHNIVYNDQHI